MPSEDAARYVGAGHRVEDRDSNILAVLAVGAPARGRQVVTAEHHVSSPVAPEDHLADDVVTALACATDLDSARGGDGHDRLLSELADLGVTGDRLGRDAEHSRRLTHQLGGGVDVLVRRQVTKLADDPGEA